MGGGGVQQKTNTKAEKQNVKNKGKMRWEKLGHPVPDCCLNIWRVL